MVSGSNNANILVVLIISRCEKNPSQTGECSTEHRYRSFGIQVKRKRERISRPRWLCDRNLGDTASHPGNTTPRLADRAPQDPGFLSQIARFRDSRWRGGIKEVIRRPPFSLFSSSVIPSSTLQYSLLFMRLWVETTCRQ